MIQCKGCTSAAWSPQRLLESQQSSLVCNTISLTCLFTSSSFVRPHMSAAAFTVSGSTVSAIKNIREPFWNSLFFLHSFVIKCDRTATGKREQRPRDNDKLFEIKKVGKDNKVISGDILGVLLIYPEMDTKSRPQLRLISDLKIHEIPC